MYILCNERLLEVLHCHRLSHCVKSTYNIEESTQSYVIQAGARDGADKK